MAKYFNYFPKTFYATNTTGSGVDLVTNVISRFTFNSAFKNNAAIFYEYDIKDGDTPETIAYKLYGDAEKHWIVLLFNDIIDPQYDWPLQQDSLIKFIDEKYAANGAANSTVQTGAVWAQSTNNKHSYYKIVTKTSSTDTTIEKLRVDANTYANVSLYTATRVLADGTSIVEEVTKESKTFYDYEVEVNESKRSIKLLKQEFIPEVEKEFKRVIKK